jgi:hypothetical protein
LFHGKCAYCESPYRAVDACDVEHYRPKGGVTEAPDHPGYWWLAATWANLLPSCPACNQRRKHGMYRLGMTLEEFEGELARRPSTTMGKGNSFLVRGGNWIETEDGDLSVEDPLLINPCEQDPEQHFEWVFDRDPREKIWEADPVFPFLRPRRTGANVEDEYAKASIAVYGLNRAGVIRERSAHLRHLQLLSQPVLDAFQDLATYPNPRGQEALSVRARLAKYKNNVVELTKPCQPYSSMAKAYLREFDAELPNL